MKLLHQHVVGGLHEIAIVPRIEVNVDVAGKSSIFVTDHRGPARKRDSSHFLYWDLCAGRCSDKDSSEVVHVVTKVAVVADVDGITLAAFDVFGDHFPADSRSEEHTSELQSQS